MGYKKYNWPLIKAEYVEGLRDEKGDLYWATYDQIGERHGVKAGNIRNVAAKEGWTQERDIYRAKVEQERRGRKVETLASEAAAFDSETLKIAKAGLRMIQIHFVKAAKVYQDNANKPMASKELDRLSRAAERYQKIGRLSLGESTEIVSSESWLDIARKGADL